MFKIKCENIDENIAEDHVSENIDVTLTGNNETGGHASSIIENPVSVNNETDECHTFQSPKPKRNKISTKNSNSRAEEAYRILKETVAFPQEPADPCSVYGAHVGNKLKTYSPRTRVEVEHAINQILYAADRGKYETSPMNAYARMDWTHQTPGSISQSNSSSQCPTPSSSHSSLDMPDLNAVFLDL
ncbi:unnamed protein product [Psylliodes chrysocephalus]|uniref:Uncharacterized protein n=1 Tax=Psylliodes chrysocephalus TaxID=3402493 RepID=A0A9P0CUH1_9CUCU|nr:unnamed protein product [Psylliodes chrysocephala]